MPSTQTRVASDLRFGPLVIERDLRSALIDGRPLTLAPKAFDLLVLLAENTDRVMSKSELLDRVWADTVVEEANLTQTVFMLRQAFRLCQSTHAWIATSPSRGYRFVAPAGDGDGVDHAGAPRAPGDAAIGDAQAALETSNATAPQPQAESTTQRVEATAPTPRRFTVAAKVCCAVACGCLAVALVGWGFFGRIEERVDGDGWLQPTPTGGELEAIAFFVPRFDGKLVWPGMDAQVSPFTVDKIVFGFLEGSVVEVGSHPPTEKDLVALGGKPLADFVSQMFPKDTVLELRVKLKKSASTPSGYAWSKKSPPIKLQVGTRTRVSVVWDQGTPFDYYVRPLIKQFRARLLGHEYYQRPPRA